MITNTTSTTITARWYCAGFYRFFLFPLYLVIRLNEWTWVVLLQFPDEVDVLIETLYHLLNFHWLVFVNSVLHLKCKSQQLLYLVYFKFSFVICRMLNGRETLIVRVNALVKRSVNLAEMNNMIIILQQQYTSFCLYIATVSIKFLLIPQFLFFILVSHARGGPELKMKLLKTRMGFVHDQIELDAVSWRDPRKVFTFFT